MAEADCDKPKVRVNRWARFIWIALVTGSIPAMITVLFGDGTSRVVAMQVLYGCLFSTCIGGLCTAVLPRIARPIMRLQPAVRWPFLAVVLIVLAAVGTFAAMFVLVLTGVVSPQTFRAEYLVSLKMAIFITLIFGLTSFSREVSEARYNLAAAELEAREKADEKLRQAAMEARLSSLESRVQPHFLFNTLNSVLALIREDPGAAERMVERLAALLRFSLDANQSRLVPLSLEAKIIRDYLDIEQARFGSRLRFSIEIPASLENLPIPPMSLQTVVENSVKYAVSSRREGAAVLLRASVAGKTARIEITDDGPGFHASPVKPGHGLELLQNRVEGLYGSEGSVEIGMSPSGGASVTVVVPYSQPMIPKAALVEVAG